MAIELSTAGIKLAYAIETTAGTKPSAFTNIAGVKSLPNLNPEPATLETTSLNEEVWRTYIDGLKDTGGALTITFNHTEAFQTTWEGLMDDYKEAKSSGKAVWWEFYVPGLTKAFFFTGNPSELGFNGAEVGAVLETAVYVVPTGHLGWATAVNPT